MKNLSQIRKKREDILTDWTVGDITENWASDIASFLEELDGEKDAIVRG